MFSSKLSHVFFVVKRSFFVTCTFQTNNLFTITKNKNIFLYKPTTFKKVFNVCRTVQKGITTMLLTLCEKWPDDNTKYISLKEFMGISSLSH